MYETYVVGTAVRPMTSLIQSACYTTVHRISIKQHCRTASWLSIKQCSYWRHRPAMVSQWTSQSLNIICLVDGIQRHKRYNWPTLECGHYTNVYWHL